MARAVVGVPMTTTEQDPGAAVAHEEDLVDEKTNKQLHGDFAGGERTRPLTPEDAQSALLEGDFASGERTLPLTEEERRKAGLHGDFAGGERTRPLTPEDDEEGSFAPDRR